MARGSHEPACRSLGRPLRLPHPTGSEHHASIPARPSKHPKVMTKWGVVLDGVLVAASAVCAYLFGLSVARQAAGRTVTDVQLMLSFNHMKRYEELRDCLRAGGGSGGREETFAGRDDAARTGGESPVENGPSTLDYIRKRSYTSIKELRRFSSDRGSRLTEPGCDEARGGS